MRAPPRLRAGAACALSSGAAVGASLPSMIDKPRLMMVVVKAGQDGGRNFWPGCTAGQLQGRSRNSLIGSREARVSRLGQATATGSGHAKDGTTNEQACVLMHKHLKP